MFEASHFAQVFKAVKQPAFHCANAARQRRGNLFERIIDVKSQVEDLPLLVRQSIEMPLEQSCTVV